MHGSAAAAEGQASDGVPARRREGEVTCRPTNEHREREIVCPLTAAVVFSVSSLQIVKFCQPGQDRVSPVSDVDIGVYQLQRSEKLLGERVEKLGLEADKYT